MEGIKLLPKRKLIAGSFGDISSLQRLVQEAIQASRTSGSNILTDPVENRIGKFTYRLTIPIGEDMFTASFGERNNYYNSEPWTAWQAISGSTVWSKAFTTTASYKVGTIWMALKNYSGGSKEFIMSIRLTDGAGNPIGSDLCSATGTAAQLSATGSWFKRNISSGATLTSGTEYAVCLRAPTMGGYPEAIGWGEYNYEVWGLATAGNVGFIWTE